jgi:hypothetical protein
VPGLPDGVLARVLRQGFLLLRIGIVLRHPDGFPVVAEPGAVLGGIGHHLHCRLRSHDSLLQRLEALATPTPRLEEFRLPLKEGVDDAVDLVRVRLHLLLFLVEVDPKPNVVAYVLSGEGPLGALGDGVGNGHQKGTQ